MKCFLFLFLIPLSFFSQEKISDTIYTKEKDLYIKDYTNQFNVKLELSNDIQKFKVPFDNQTIKIEPNLALKYAVVLSYKFASVRIGLRPKVSDNSENKKGTSDAFRLRTQLLFNKWLHRIEYNYIKGYYITDKNISPNTNNTGDHLKFPNLKTNIFSWSTSYKLNENYSIRSTISQTEAQLQSAGSFIPGVDFWYYDFDGLDTYINSDGTSINRTTYTESSGFDFILNTGYHYTYVYKKWYANAFIKPGIGVDFNKTILFNDGNKQTTNSQDLIVSLDMGIGIGYNSEKIFFGTSFNRRDTNEKENINKIQFDSSKNTFYIFFGYRFKAPKQISKPIDVIEEKIPILKKD